MPKHHWRLIIRLHRSLIEKSPEFANGFQKLVPRRNQPVRHITKFLRIDGGWSTKRSTEFFQARKAITGPNPIGLSGSIQVPRDSRHGECLEIAVHRPTRAFEFFCQRIDAPTPGPHDQVQCSQQPAEPFALTQSSLGISPLLPGHSHPFPITVSSTPQASGIISKGDDNSGSPDSSSSPREEIRGIDGRSTILRKDH